MAAITAHMVVKNEEQWVWYALTALLPYFSKIIVFDTGSTDQTAFITTKISSSKIVFEKKGRVDAAGITRLRNEQIARTKTDWFMLADGDEVWPQKALKEAVQMTQTVSEEITALVSRCVVPLGDLFHIQPEKFGRYMILNKTGHFNIRIYRKRKGHYWRGNYPLEAYVNGNNKPVQNRPQELVWLKEEYWHMTHLPRSSKENHHRQKLELGRKVERQLPEAFFSTRPIYVPSPWIYFSPENKAIAGVLTPLMHLKRKLIQ